MKKFYLLLLVFLAILVPYKKANAEDTASYAYKKKKYEFRVNKRYLEGKYEECYENYKQLFLLDSANYQYNLDCGMMLFDDLNNPGEAYPILKRALRYSPPDTVPDLVSNFAHSAHHLLRFNEAVAYYRMYNRITNPKDRPERHNIYIDKAMSDCEYAMVHTQINDTLILENLGGNVNTKYPEYIPVIDSKDSVLYYTSRRPENNNGSIDTDDNMYFEDVYQCLNSPTGFKKPEKFDILERVTSDRNFNQNLVHKSIVALSFDEKELFMFKENKLWSSKKKANGKWATPELMDAGLNVTRYQTHTTLSPDGKTMFLAAEATNIIGNRDIQISHKRDDGTWEIPKSISDSINTPFEENSPVICNDGKTLFFSSQGLPGYGGYDIFKSTYKDGHWSKPVNMGLPINSPGDDIYFSDNTNDGTAYFASNRSGGFGDQDIYKVTPTPEKLAEYIPKPFVVELDGTKSIDKDGSKLSYEWDFGDGTFEKGIVSEHPYKRPGKYIIKLNTFDESSKFTEYDDYEIPVEIKNVTHIEIESPDTIFEDEEVILNGSNSSIRNVPISKRLWQMNDGTNIKDSSTIHVTFKKAGIYPVKYFCRGRNDSLHLKVGYFVTKNIVVVPEEEAKTIRLRKIKKERIRKHVVDSIQKSEERQLSHRSLSAPVIQTNDIVAPVLTAEDKAEIAKAKIQRAENLIIEKENAEKAFVNEAMANNKADITMNLEAGFDASTTKIDTTNLPDVSLEPIYFNLDKFEIRRDASQTLNKNIEVMKLYPDFVFKVSGYTDVRGSNEYNIRLSNKRALSTIAYLVANGIPENRITGILSKGENTAKFKDDTKTGVNEKEYQLDRRVEFSILGRIIK